MAGHGSPPAEDKGSHPGRQVGRSSLPRLTAAMQWQGSLSQGEASSALSGLRRGDTGAGGEAVWHYGGASKMVRDVMKNPTARKYGKQYSQLRAND